MAERITVNSKKPVIIKENLISQRRKTDFRSNSSSGNRILYLQRTIGNQAVQRLIKSGTLQAKLRIGQPGDIYEQEADRVADAVMRMPEPGVQRQVEEEEEEEILQKKPLVDQITQLVQRQVEEEEELLQAKSMEDATSEVSHGLESQINAIKGGGRPLAESERAYFEPRFGHDFGQVRVHTDTMAAEAARGVNARAFTVGKNVVFGAGEYAPESSTGRRLMVHELAHVIQQKSSFYKQDTGSVAGKVTRLPQSRLIAREEGAGPERVSSASAGPKAHLAAQNIYSRYNTENILIDGWSSDCRDNNKNGSFDNNDPFERNANFGSHIGVIRNGFRTIGGWTCHGGEGGQVNTVDFNTNERVLYSVCATIVSQAYRAAGVHVPNTPRVRDLINWFQGTNHNSRFWLLSNFSGMYLPGDFICSFDGNLGHAGMVVGSGSGTPMVIHLPGTSQHISRGIYDPTRLTDLTREPWPHNRSIYGIGRYFG